MGKRGGYRREKPVYKLTFEGEEFDGLEVMAKSVPLGEFFAMQRLAEEANSDTEAAERLIRWMADVLLSWNLLGDDDQVVPLVYAQCTVSGKPGKPGEACSAHGDGTAEDKPERCEYTGLVAQDLPFVMAITQAWQRAVASVPNPSPTDSSDGATSLELSIPMEAV